MNSSYDLTQLDENSFEHLVNSLATRVLGAGHTGFGPGADGGRDGYFEGTAPYPNESDQWIGIWYIQSKFHKPHLSTDSQKWLLSQIKSELERFTDPSSDRRWPDIWIIATNIDPSGKPETGAFDKAKKLVEAANADLAKRFHIWGGSKILDYLSANEDVARRYGHFLTPGHVLSKVYNHFADSQAEIKTILQHLIVKQFDEQRHTKLEQAGSDADTRPGIHRLFIDLPFKVGESGIDGFVMRFLTRSSARNHQFDTYSNSLREWKTWSKHPSRSRVWFVKGGPGRGKSTVGQYFSQIQRAALILQEEGPDVIPAVKETASEVKEKALEAGFWPTVPRIPINIELKDYAQWFGNQGELERRGILTYLSQKIGVRVEQEVQVGTLKRALQAQSWLAIFDGLDEVPQDVKDDVAAEVRHFINDVYVENKIDLLTICTSRPQGYSGQFSDLEAAVVTLTNLSPEQALSCAKPVLEIGRSEEESEKSFEMLRAAIESHSVKEIMTTPLQSHIMAVVVRDGGRPPDRRWQLYRNFYDVIKRREANRNLPDKKLAKLLREDEQLLKAVHNRLGFVLHARAEKSTGAQTSLNREEFQELVKQTVTQMVDTDVEDVVDTLMKATTERLVLVNTPDDGDHVRYDIRPLQEFFASEFVYEGVTMDRLRERVEVIAGDAHWREVMHFLLSALIENQRQTELAVVINILHMLDEEGETLELKTLNKRLARGSLLTKRLLREGVLEQDKRVREQFKKCLEPLLACTSPSLTWGMVRTEQKNSREWLINVLLEALQKFSESENSGAAFALTYIVDDNHPKAEEVRNLFLNFTPSQLNHVFSPERFVDDDFDIVVQLRNQGVAQWFIETVVILLLSEKWHNLNDVGLSGALRILKSHEQYSLQFARSYGLNEYEVALFEELLRSESPLREAKYGNLKIDLYKHDWTTGTFEIKSWQKALPDSSEVNNGLIGLADKIFRFANEPTNLKFNGVIDYLRGNFSILLGLPPHLQAYLPIDFEPGWNKLLTEVSSLDSQSFDTFLEIGELGSAYIAKPIFTANLGAISPEDWVYLRSNFPYVAFVNFCYQLAENSENVDVHQIFRSHDTNEFILKSKRYLASVPRLWLDLLALAGDEKEELKRAILDSAKEFPQDTLVFFRQLPEPHYVPNLPEERVLLPHLLKSISSSPHRFFRERRNLDDVTEQALAVAPDRKLLELVADQTDYNADVRVAAHIFLLLLGNREKLGELKEILRQFYAVEFEEWFMTPLLDYLEELPGDAEMRQFVGELLNISRGNLSARAFLQDRLLDVWREKSAAPIEKSALLDKWLSN